MSGRQLAKQVGRSHTAVQRALVALVEQGLVERHEAPPAALYALNADHIAAPLAFEMADLSLAFATRLRDHIAGWTIVTPQATLFGSTARRDGGLDSDIDVLVIRPDSVHADDRQWRAQVDGMAEAIERWTGNHTQILELADEEVRHRPPGPTALDGAIEHGVPLTERTLQSFLRGSRLF